MGNITGNQDRPRFISLAGGSVRFDEDQKYAGWTRKIDAGHPSAYEKLKLLHALNMTIPGIPVIYYGDEVGIPGANDPDNRRWMRFDELTGEENAVKETVSKLAALRNGSMPLLYGDLKFIDLEGRGWGFLRSYFDQYVYVFFNNTADQQTVKYAENTLSDKELKANWGSDFHISDDEISLTLAPYSFEILTTKK
jgi:glycosidase